MADYIWTESPGTTRDTVPRIVATKFGDGYEQRADDGLNPQAEVWDVVHTDVEGAIADEIDAFLRPGMGRVTFDWVPPRQTVAKKFKCTALRITLTQTFGFYDISARFEQVFEP